MILRLYLVFPYFFLAHSFGEEDVDRHVCLWRKGESRALCTIFTILLTFFGKSCNAHMLHASGVYYSYMVSGPNFEFRKVITQLLAPRYLFLELIQGAFWAQNGKNNGFTKMSVES